MVKNTKGGHHKNIARKDAVRGSSTKTRLPIDEGEVYAVVLKMCGGNICQVKTINDSTLNCVIRGKFSGKFKRSNTIAIGSIVLVGLRSWESSSTSCDLLEIYDNNNINVILSIPNSNLHLILPEGWFGSSSNSSGLTGGDTSEINFENTANVFVDMKPSTTSKMAATDDMIGLSPSSKDGGDTDDGEDDFLKYI